MSRRPAARAFWLPAIPLAAFGLRVYHLGLQELRGDEAFGYFFSQNSLGEIVRETLANKEPHPVGSYFLQNAWLQVAGHNEFALRFTSTWFSVLAVALLYRLARRLGLSRTIGATAAGLLAVSPYAIWHAQDARMYSMLLALVVASAWLALEALARDRLRDWAAYIAVTWLALHTHYSAAFVLLAENIFVVSWVLRERRGRDLIRWLAGQAVLLLLFTPWLWLVGKNLAGYSGNGDSPGWPAMIDRSLSALAFGDAVPSGLRAGAALLAGLILALGLIWLLQKRQGQVYAGAWLAVALAIPLGATWLSGANRPIFNERYLVAALPPFELLLATGLVNLSHLVPGRPENPARAGRPAVALAATALLALAAVVGMGSMYEFYAGRVVAKPNGWRGLAASMERLGAGIPAGRLRVAQSYPDPTLWYYYKGPAAHLVLPPRARDAAGARREVTALVEQGVDRVLLADYATDVWDPSGIGTAALAKDFTLVDKREIGAWTLGVYIRPDRAALPRLGAAFANGITLDRGNFEPVSLNPDGLLVVSLAWTGPGTALTGNEKVFVHLAGPDDRPFAQIDQPLTGDQLGGITNYSIRVPETLAAGDYRILAGIYDPGRPGALRISLTDGRDHVLLGTVKCTGQATGRQS
ncbi:MAG TPA: glycosyltransferase family 39 protein [Anaerolineae bacterium]